MPLTRIFNVVVTSPTFPDSHPCVVVALYTHLSVVGLFFSATTHVLLKYKMPERMLDKKSPTEMGGVDLLGEWVG